MQESSTRDTSHPSVLQFRQDLEVQLRRQVREAIETVLEAELITALGSGRHERTERRQGYRHGALEWRITTSDGLRELQVPRGRVRHEDGTTAEFRSQLLPRYARRTRDVDAAILGSYLAGANSRRIRIALKPLLGERHLSKSAVSRIVARLKALFATWQCRDLHGERYAVLFLDGFHLKVRMARRVIAVPVLAALGMTDNGQKTARRAAYRRHGSDDILERVTDGFPATRAAVAAAGGHRWARGFEERAESLADGTDPTVHDTQGAQSRGRVSCPRTGGVETRLPSDHSRRRWPRGSGGV